MRADGGPDMAASRIRKTNWKSRTLATVLLLTAIFFGAVISTPIGCHEPDRRQAHEVEETTYLFPLARQGSTVHHTFTVHNNLSEPIRIDKIDSSCGCTAANVSVGTEIPPDGVLGVPVSMELGGKDGQAESQVTLQMAGRPDPIVLTMKGNVHADCPPTIDFGNVKRGAEEMRVFHVKRFPAQPPLLLAGHKTDDTLLSVKYPSVPMDESVEVQVRLRANIPFGVIDELLEMQINDVEAPIKSIRIRGYVLSPLEVSERTVFFGQLKADETLSKSLTLISPYGAPLQVVSVENSRPEVFSCVVGESAAPSATELPVTVTTTGAVPSDAPSGPLKGTVIFRALVGEAEQEIRVELYGLKP